MDRKPVVLCLGDSHTQGFFGASWVRSLSTALPCVRFVNTGVNGTQTKNVYASLGRVLDNVKTESLVGVTLLIGTNDCLLSLAADRQDAIGQQYYRLMNGYKEPANAEVFKQHFQSLVTDLEERLRQRTKPAPRQVKLLVLTLPPIGEVLDEKTNKKVDEYNATIWEVVQQHQQRHEAASDATGTLEVVLLDLNGKCKAAIESKFGNQPPASGVHGCSGGSSAPDIPKVAAPQGLASSFWDAALIIVSCVFRRYLMSFSFDRQSRLAGTVVLTPDCIHLNDAGAELVRGLVEPELRKIVAPAMSG